MAAGLAIVSFFRQGLQDVELLFKIWKQCDYLSVNTLPEHADSVKGRDVHLYVGDLREKQQLKQLETQIYW